VISGGTLNSRQWFTLGFAGSSSNNASVTQNGGTINVNTSGGGLLEMGVFDATTNLFTLNSGSVNLQNNAAIGFGQGGNHTGTSTFTQNGGAVTFFSDGGTTIGGTGSLNLGNGGSTGNYAYNLNGGTLTIPSISKAGGGASGSFNFNGGILVAAGSTATFLQDLTAANILNGGAIINTNGSDVTIAQPLLDAGTGGLTKQGAGTLTLAGTNTYDGNTSISSGGRLVLADNASLRFVPGPSGVSNRITGSGSLQLDGDFFIDLAGASTTPGGSWTLVDVGSLTETYGSTFTVSGWTESSPGVWISPAAPYRFTEATGLLEVVNGDLDGDGMADSFEQGIIAANPADGINTINDVLPQADFDGDGTNNLTEFRLGLDPTNANSRFFITSTDGDLSDGYTVNWQGKAGVTFKVERSSSLASGQWSVIHTVTPGADGPLNFTDPHPVPAPRAFYRITLDF
jgi:autotransporter-associated beta strand protein